MFLIGWKPTPRKGWEDERNGARRDAWPTAKKGVGMLAIAAALLCTGAQAQDVTYRTPPRCLVWLEGEDCVDHNWVDGPQRNCWAFGWAGVHGGVLDLASWRLPKEGAYTARLPFELAESGDYVLYFLGRVPGMLASPFTWRVDGGLSALSLEQIIGQVIALSPLSDGAAL